MYSDEIVEYLERLPVSRYGVLAADQLPMRIEAPSVIIVNTDPLRKPGRHWIAMTLDRERNLEYFDSFGQPPSVVHHIAFILRNARTFKYNVITLQSPTSTLCGIYCIMFLYYRSFDYSMTDYLSIFSKDRISNDFIIYKNFYSVFIHNHHCYRTGW